MSNKRNCMVLAVLVLLLLSACTAQSNPSVGTEAANGDIAGFWYGLWHGIIAPFTFIISLFDQDFHFYEVHTTETGTTSDLFSGLEFSSAAAVAQLAELHEEVNTPNTRAYNVKLRLEGRVLHLPSVSSFKLVLEIILTRQFVSLIRCTDQSPLAFSLIKDRV